MFTEAERKFLIGARLARIATVDNDGQVDVAPVTFGFDGRTFTIGGRRAEKTLKVKNVAAGNEKVALVVDDLLSLDPWQPRGVKVHGTAEVRRDDRGRTQLRIRPTTHWSWGLNSGSYEIRRTDWEDE